MKPLSIAFGVLFTISAALSLAAAILIVASLFIADRRPEGMTWIIIHLAVGSVFAVFGLLLAGSMLQILGIAKISSALQGDAAGKLRARVVRLLVLLDVGAIGLCGVLGIIVWAILARIDEGFAAFG